MKPEDRLILICLRQNFKAEHITAVAELAHSVHLNWDRIAITTKQHGVAGLIYRNLLQCQSYGLEIPEKANHRLRLLSYDYTIKKEKQKERLIRALGIFEDIGLEVMLIKGAALDICVYERSDYVLSEDIDIILHAKREDCTKEYRKKIADFFYGEGIEFDFYSHHDIDINNLISVDFESVWEQSTLAEYAGYPVRYMSPTDFVLSLCINCSRKRYFHLKSLCDISETLQAKPEISLQQLAERACAFQCENIVYTSLLVDSIVTKINLPTYWEDYFEIHPVRRKLINSTTFFMIKNISFYPYPYVSISIFGRPFHINLLLPYFVYTGKQLKKKFPYIVHNWDINKNGYQL